jgi:IS5 family transposase
MSLRWTPPIETSALEDKILARCKKAKLFVFLRQQRHRLFDDDFQVRLASMYVARTAGKAPVPPAMLAMVTLLQAALDVSDEDAVEFAVMDRRWQMLLGTLGTDEAPFSQGSLFNFRERLIAHDLDEALLDRTVALAKETRGFSFKSLRAAFDASPLFGAGRVEDTFNLIGHAARELLRAAAKRLSLDEEAAAVQAGIPLVTGSSLKASLDIVWDDPKQRKAALERLLEQVRSLTAFVERELSAELDKPPLAERWATLKQVLSQDLEPDPDGGSARIKRGVARERRISVRDGQMRHGRKSKTGRIDGYKRHLAVDVESTLVVGAAVTPANRPEGEAASDLLDDVKRHAEGDLADVFIDRGYLAAEALHAQRQEGTAVHCKAFPLHNAGRFTKADFVLDLDEQRLTCPAGQTVPFELGATVHFPAAACRACPKRPSCTTATDRGRSVSIHPHEAFLVQLRATQKSPEGRAINRRRVVVEHGLAAISRTQGRRARYLGVRKNLFDLRRHAAVANLHVAARAA